MPKQRRPTYDGCSVGARNGKLRLRFRWQGRARSRATGLPDTAENRRAVEKLADLVGAAIAAGEDPTPALEKHYGRAVVDLSTVPVEPSTPGPTVSDYFHRWLEERTPVIRKAQARDYRRHLGSWVVPTLGDVALADLRASDVRGLQAELLGKGLSVKYVKNILNGSFRAMVRQARRDELVTRDVFADLEWPKWKPPGPDPFLPDERTRIIEWFRAKRFGFHPGTAGESRYRFHPPYHVFVHVLFWTGLRPSEAAGLQWQDIDLDGARLHVQRSRHLYEYGAPKTESADRWVELFPETVTLLRNLQELHVTPETPVFSTLEGEPIEPKPFGRTAGTPASARSAFACAASTARRTRTSRRPCRPAYASRGWSSRPA